MSGNKMALRDGHEPFLSVVVVITDETAHLLPFTLDSIVSQSVTSFEIIVIDGQTRT